MLLISVDRATYNTATMTHINQSSAVETNAETQIDETWYQIWINYGKMFNGAASVDTAYLICDDLSLPKINQIEDKIIEAIKNRTPVLDIVDVISEVDEEMA